MRHRVSTVIALLALLFGAAASAQPEAKSIETTARYGGYTVHYTVFPSTFLQEAVAAGLGIVRAPDRSVVNIAVRRETEQGDRAASALLKGRYSDLIQSKPLEFQEIREPGAIYYLAVFRHGNQETLRFDIAVKPDPNAAAHELTFVRTLAIER